MNIDDEKRLTKNHQYLVKHLQVGEISGYLLEKGVISWEEHEELELEPISFKKSKKFLRILRSKGPNAYALFRTALLESESISFIADELDSTNISEVVISGSTFEQEDKMSQLQQQMCLRTELLMQYKRDRDALEQRLKANEQRTEELQTKYGDFEKTMQDHKLTNTEAINYLKEYLNNRDIPDFSFQIAPSPSPSPSKTDTSTTPSKSFTFSPTDIDSNSHELCEAIARDIGKDVVRYMVQTLKENKVKAPSSKYSALMRKNIDDVLSQHEDLFTQFIFKLQIEQINGYDTFVNVADEMFMGENNWGRIVVLYAFVGFVARHAAENGNEKMAMFMGDFLGFYVAKKLGAWIEANGGWVSVFAWSL